MNDKQVIKQSIEKLYADHYESLRAFLLSKDKNVDLINDIAQEVFIKTHIFIAKGKIIKSPRSWLFRVGQNLLIDHYRKDRKLIEISESEMTLPENSDQKDHSPADCLHGIVANLPYKYKKAVYLIDIKGVKPAQAATQLKLNVATFKTHLLRGRQLVTKAYMDCCDYELDESGHLVGEIKDREQCKVCS